MGLIGRCSDMLEPRGAKFGSGTQRLDFETLRPKSIRINEHIAPPGLLDSFIAY